VRALEKFNARDDGTVWSYADLEEMAEAAVAELEDELARLRILTTALAVNWRGSSADLDMIWKLGVDAGANEATREEWRQELTAAGKQGIMSWFIDWVPE